MGEDHTTRPSSPDLLTIDSLSVLKTMQQLQLVTIREGAVGSMHRSFSTTVLLTNLLKQSWPALFLCTFGHSLYHPLHTHTDRFQPILSARWYTLGPHYMLLYFVVLRGRDRDRRPANTCWNMMFVWKHQPCQVDQDQIFDPCATPYMSFINPLRRAMDEREFAGLRGTHGSGVG